jgi:hypothetical protein
MFHNKLDSHGSEYTDLIFMDAVFVGSLESTSTNNGYTYAESTATMIGRIFHSFFLALLQVVCIIAVAEFGR